MSHTTPGSHVKTVTHSTTVTHTSRSESETDIQLYTDTQDTQQFSPTRKQRHTTTNHRQICTEINTYPHTKSHDQTQTQTHKHTLAQCQRRNRGAPGAQNMHQLSRASRTQVTHSTQPHRRASETLHAHELCHTWEQRCTHCTDTTSLKAHMASHTHTHARAPRQTHRPTE